MGPGTYNRASRWPISFFAWLLLAVNRHFDISGRGLTAANFRTFFLTPIFGGSWDVECWWGWLWGFKLHLGSVLYFSPTRMSCNSIIQAFL